MRAGRRQRQAWGGSGKRGGGKLGGDSKRGVGKRGGGSGEHWGGKLEGGRGKVRLLKRDVLEDSVAEMVN